MPEPTYSISCNLDRLKTLIGTDLEFIYYNYKWTEHPRIPNKVCTELTDKKDAKSMYTILTVRNCFALKNWLD
jgi:hypothetical protein